jgi:hypothetical protein
MPEKNIHSLFAYYAIAFEGKIIHAGKITTEAEEGFPAQLYFTEELLREFLTCLKANQNTVK